MQWNSEKNRYGGDRNLVKSFHITWQTSKHQVLGPSWDRECDSNRFHIFTVHNLADFQTSDLGTVSVTVIDSIFPLLTTWQTSKHQVLGPLPNIKCWDRECVSNRFHLFIVHNLAYFQTSGLGTVSVTIIDSIFPLFTTWHTSKHQVWDRECDSNRFRLSTVHNLTDFQTSSVGTVSVTVQ
ncbi:hypothetical protein J6590_030252 [Homalodisca vitripennis]|nr:hypothetical protein J6590_030252 [Homalodisca vitripennis]